MKELVTIGGNLGKIQISVDQNFIDRFGLEFNKEMIVNLIRTLEEIKEQVYKHG